VPEKPEAWLLTVARRRLIDAARRARVQAEPLPALIAMAEEAQAVAGSEVTFPDERLKLLFLCAHPAIDAAARTPLMLQTGLGLNAARIVSAFLVRPSAMGQRLSRANAKIRDARIRSELPEAGELPARLDAVLEAIYAAYGSGWEQGRSDAGGRAPIRAAWDWPRKRSTWAGSSCGTGRWPPICSSACRDPRRPVPPSAAPSACARIRRCATSWRSRHWRPTPDRNPDRPDAKKILPFFVDKSE
jgi:hypothetical protein